MTGGHLTVRALERSDGAAAIAVINRAAAWYAEFLPAAEFEEPEMTIEGWIKESRRMTWYGAFDEALVAVMGLERAGSAVLLRHAYVLPHRQREGIASHLLSHLEREATGAKRIIVGTYAANYKARAALESAGYQLSPDPEQVLRAYYRIPEERLNASVTYEKRVTAQ